MGASRRLRSAVAALAALSAAVGARAQDAPATRFELTPYAAYRFGGDFSSESGDRSFDLGDAAAHGIIFSVRARDVRTQWEALYERQSTDVETLPSFGDGRSLDMDVEYLHFGGTFIFDGDRTRPFVALTAGVSRFDPGENGVSGETYFSASIGAGVQLLATRQIGIRLEGRAFASLVDSDGRLFCASGGATSGCALAIDGEVLTQWEARAGVVFRF